MQISLDERSSYAPGRVNVSHAFISACRKGYFDYCIHGGSYAQAYKHVPPHLCWAYTTGSMAAETCQGLAQALHTLTLEHTPGVSYSYNDGLKTNKTVSFR